jgi:ribosomal protein L17
MASLFDTPEEVMQQRALQGREQAMMNNPRMQNAGVVNDLRSQVRQNRSADMRSGAVGNMAQALMPNANIVPELKKAYDIKNIREKVNQKFKFGTPEYFEAVSTELAQNGYQNEALKAQEVGMSFGLNQAKLDEAKRSASPQYKQTKVGNKIVTTDLAGNIVNEQEVEETNNSLKAVSAFLKKKNITDVEPSAFKSVSEAATYAKAFKDNDDIELESYAKYTDGDKVISGAYAKNGDFYVNSSGKGMEKWKGGVLEPYEAVSKSQVQNVDTFEIAKDREKILEGHRDAYVGTSNVISSAQEIKDTIVNNPTAYASMNVAARLSSISSFLKSLPDAVEGTMLYDSDGEPTKDMTMDDFNDKWSDLGVTNATVKTLMLDLAYQMASSENAGRPSDADVKNAIDRLSGITSNSPKQAVAALNATVKTAVKKYNNRMEGVKRYNPEMYNANKEVFQKIDFDSAYDGSIPKNTKQETEPDSDSPVFDPSKPFTEIR